MSDLERRFWLWCATALIVFLSLQVVLLLVALALDVLGLRHGAIP